MHQRYLPEIMQSMDAPTSALTDISELTLHFLEEGNHHRAIESAHKCLSLAKDTPEITPAQVLYLQNYFSEAFAATRLERLRECSEEWDAEIRESLDDLSDAEDRSSLHEALEKRQNVKF